MRLRYLLLALAISCTIITAVGQSSIAPCANEDPMLLQQIHHNDPVRIAAMEQADQDLEQFTGQFVEQERAGSLIIIPVVFHVMHTNGPEFINEDQVRDAVSILNRDLRKLNPDTANIVPGFSGLAADTEIEFRLAQKDPNGNCTRGVNWVETVLTHQGDQDMKDLIQWPRDMYLNVWSCASAGGAAGYSQYPSSVDGPFGAPSDGIVLLHSYVGSIGTGSISRSRTFTHEVGHWINLRHCWGNSNSAADPANCNMDDNVNDTPLTQGWTGCNTAGQSCGSLDNVQNYMEYSGCRMMFTQGQKQRMRAALNSSTADRNELWQPNNLTATGVVGPGIMCEAEFNASKRIICAGDSVQFEDQSYHGVTQWNWSFAGGTANSTAIQDPTVTYNTPGIYDVSLTASNSNGTESEAKTGFITVLTATGSPVPLIEGFESASMLPNSDWAVNNVQDDETFEITSTAAYTGSKSTFINNHAVDEGELDELISAPIDMSGATSINISFKYSFARKNSANDDRLRIYVSKDCGTTWLLRAQLRGQTDLSTASDQNSFFIPSGTSEWEEGMVNNVTSDYHVDGFQVKFWFESDGGNNLYLDDININGSPVGVQEFFSGLGELLVVPNPTTDATELICQLKEGGMLQVQLLDVTGRAIQDVFNHRVRPGTTSIPLRTASLRKGVYFIRVALNGSGQVLRIVKE